NNAPPDTTLLSDDDVLFYVHAAVIRRASSNHFGGLITRAAPAHVRMPEDTPTLTVVLCTAYGLPLPDAPDWGTLTRALAASVERYGLPPLAGTEALHFALLAHVHRPGGATEVYALAARHGVEPLAVAASEHLLSLDLSTIDDDFARAVGAVYLKRLFFLHLGRVEALKRILSAAPGPLHPPTTACTPETRQRDVTLPWAVTITHLTAEARPDMPGSQIEAALNPIAYRCACVQCSQAVTARIQAVLLEWSTIKASGLRSARRTCT
ncbi:hypothetical protein AURDEDRAFT_74047, partial [Auricularia subglabra TFB-10046 SS5]